MDLNLIVAAQRMPKNQLHFDADAFDRANLRADEVRSQLRTGWSGLKAHIYSIADRLRYPPDLATPTRA